MLSANRWLVLFLVSCILLLVVVDTTILYTALPRIAQDMAVSATAKLWILNAYPLVVAGLLPLTGPLSDRVGHKTMFLCGLPLFALASLVAGLAPNTAVLIAARAALGVGAAVMMPSTLAITRFVFTDPRERALAIGIWAAMASSGAALGPLLGGVLLEHFRWGAVFLVNLPVVAVLWPLGWALLPRTGGQGRARLDWGGALLCMAGMALLLGGLKELSHARPAWGQAAAALAAGGALLTLFVRRQRRRSHPMIDFALFRDPAFAVGILAALAASAAVVGMEFVLSQRLQLVEGRSPLDAALYALPMALAAVVAGPLAASAIARHGSAAALSACLGLSAASLAVLAFLPGAGLVEQAVLGLAGLGLGGAMTAASTSIMLSSAEHQSGMAASLEDLAYELGSVGGVTVLGCVLSVVYALAAPPELGDSLDAALRMGAEAGPVLNQAFAGFLRGYDLAVMMAVALLLAPLGLAVRRI